MHWPGYPGGDWALAAQEDIGQVLLREGMAMVLVQRPRVAWGALGGRWVALVPQQEGIVVLATERALGLLEAVCGVSE